MVWNYGGSTELNSKFMVWNYGGLTELNTWCGKAMAETPLNPNPRSRTLFNTSSPVKSSLQGCLILSYFHHIANITMEESFYTLYFP